MHARQRAGHPHRPDRVALRAVRGVRTFPRGEGSQEVEAEVAGPRLPLQRGATIRVHEHSMRARRAHGIPPGVPSPNRQMLSAVAEYVMGGRAGDRFAASRSGMSSCPARAFLAPSAVCGGPAVVTVSRRLC